MAKAKQRFTWDRNATTGVAVKTDTATGETFKTTLDSFPDVIQENIAVYGLSKIFDDRLSQVPADHKITECAALQLQLEKGNWKAERTGGIHLLPLVIEAIMQAKGCGPAQAQEAYKALDDEQRMVLKENLKDEMAAIAEARSKAAEVGLEDLLS